MKYEFETAGQVWSRLAGIKQPLMTRVERYAALTIPKVCLPEGFQPESMDQTHDYQSLGAQAVNHVVNKLVLAMFAPSRPFFRVQLGKEQRKEIEQGGVKPTELDSLLAQIEREAVKELDGRGQRPKIYQANRHLVITGNVLLILDKGQLRTMGLRYYCVKRTSDGDIHTLVIREHVRFDELDTSIQDLWKQGYSRDHKVYTYKIIKRAPNGSYSMCQYVDETRLPEKWDARWANKESLPYHALTWDLADESDYGTGLVEEYAGDFESLSVLSESIVTGAVVGTEFRWAINPSGQTSVDDVRNSVNGDVIAANAKDIGTVSPPIVDAVKIAQSVSQGYEQRISRGFLMGSAVTRDAERVTAEEVRLTAMELESSFGGVYSTLAPSMQKPLAQWLLKTADLDIKGTKLTITIVTGLDAISRNGDLENLRLAIGDLGQFMNTPPGLQERIDWDALAAYVGAGRGVELSKFMLPEEQVQANRKAAQQAQVQTETGIAEGKANAEAAAQPQQ